jgi:hypothetical protein
VPPLRPIQLTPNAFGKPRHHRNSWDRWVLIFVSDRKKHQGPVHISANSRISQTASLHHFSISTQARVAPIMHTYYCPSHYSSQNNDPYVALTRTRELPRENHLLPLQQSYCSFVIGCISSLKNPLAIERKMTTNHTTKQLGRNE